jgi:thimet oligopeptidase
MAKNAQTVNDFYKELRPLVRRKAKLDWAEFTAAKREHVGDPQAELYPWDQSFYEKRLMKSKYAVDSEKVREYFPLQRVIDGLFSITQSLYGLEYREVTDHASSKGRKRWHPDVRLYEVYDKSSGELLGEFFLDLHPRPNKYNHAAMWGLIPRKVWPDGRVQLPLAALVCNFTKPTDGKPSLMSHDEVETFFHEFGHCLHGILTGTSYGRFSGTAVPRDFVEAPSQMFENWVWDPRVVNTFAAHYKTGEPLPEKLLQGMLDARNLGSGMKAEHQFYYALVDMAYHTQEDETVDSTKIATDLFGQIELYEPVDGTHFQSSFGHLVGYEAGYYGYMWSKVYAEDMFQRFKELGMLDPKAGQYYREKILARGGSMDALEMVEDYLGRKPEMEPFLRHLGLDPEATKPAE